MSVTEPRLVSADRLREYCTDILHQTGLSQDDAHLVADSLVDANLRGVDSHGVTRIPIYVTRIRRGLTNTAPDVRIVREDGGVILIDGDNGAGQVVMQRAMEIALDRLPVHRTVSVAVRNSNHYGAGAYFAKQAASRGAAFFLYGNAPSTMVAWGGRQRFLGTNPYTFSVPIGSREPIVLDMASSVVARGKIILASQLGRDIPEGWAVDVEGHPTVDATAALEGSVVPFGGPKGYGIALMIEIMAAVLSGSHSGPEVGDLYTELDRPQGVGAYLSMTDISAVQPLDQFSRKIENLVDAIKLTARDGGEVLVPGEIEQRNAARRLAEGVPIAAAVAQSLEELSGSPFPAEPVSKITVEAQ